ncbi:MAG TPA: radical SAM protein [Ruminococcus sp.]|nr:radical SAM protein [Ruminococcus sp.]
MEKFIYVYMKENNVKVLGHGIRYVLWVQGCNRRCKGCIAENAQDMKKGTPVNINALALEIALSDAEGLTISGGEPFLQAQPLSELIDKIHAKRKMGIIVYTGFRYEELKTDMNMKSLLDRTDLLIDGEYIQELDDGKSLRGSSNQRIIPLTDLYKDCLGEYGQDNRQMQVFYHGIYVHEIGIPINEKRRKL